MGIVQIVLLSFMLAVSLSGCSGCGSGGGAAKQQQPSPAGLTVIEVRITNSESQEYSVQAEVAETPAQREAGLMNRASLAEDAGMLFVFETEYSISFWMKDTLIPLDMIFADADKIIVDIRRDAQPGDLIPYTSIAPAKYVLEVNGGYCDEKNIDIGDTLAFDGY